VPDGPTFASIECRLAALLAHVNGEPRLGDFGPKLAHSVEKASERTSDADAACGQPSLKKARKRLQQTDTALVQFAHRLNGLSARKKLGTLRQPFLDEAASIQSDVKTLRGALVCPADASSR